MWKLLFIPGLDLFLTVGFLDQLFDDIVDGEATYELLIPDRLITDKACLHTLINFIRD